MATYECACPCVQRRRLESLLPFKRTAILVAYLCSLVLAALAVIMFAVSLYMEDRPNFSSVLAYWGIDSKHLAFILLLISAVTPFVDKLQQFWVELEVTSKADASVPASAFGVVVEPFPHKESVF